MTTELKRRPVAFKTAYGTSKNFVTPEVDGYFRVRNLYVELSHGDLRPMSDSLLYGVTVVDKDGNRTNLSKSFLKKKDALAYIASIERCPEEVPQNDH